MLLRRLLTLSVLSLLLLLCKWGTRREVAEMQEKYAEERAGEE